MSVSRSAGSDTMPPPRQMWRRSEDDVRSNTTVILNYFVATIQECKPDDGDSKKRPTPTSSNEVEDKEKEKENFSSVTSTVAPVSKSGHKRLQNQLAFRGRGCCARDLGREDLFFLRGYQPHTPTADDLCRSGKTINAEYVMTLHRM